ncbi:AAA family ATPase [Haloferax sp. MBLA0077]|uniref:AAA family ATPase n=4 Tax=Haloferax TaxID=2251 RepID=A0A6G1Z7C2_9EURY|nr:AAA family ATPase [Haloferax sp. CBA1149]MRW82393.1 AAA family ATPase [Haloferax marinisediminis]
MTEEPARPSVSLSPHALGQYVRLSSCPRYFRLKFIDTEVKGERQWYEKNSLSSFLGEVGLAFEANQLAALADVADAIVGLPEDHNNPVALDEMWTDPHEYDCNSPFQQAWDERNQTLVVKYLSRASRASEEEKLYVLFQPPMVGQVGVWDIRGYADIVLIESTSTGVRTKVLEVKSSWSEKTSHQLQATVYSMLLDDLATNLGVEHEAQAAVINRESNLAEIDLSEVSPFETEPRVIELNRLLRRDGELHKLYDAGFNDVGYRLEQKCDGCPFHQICFTKAIESKDPALLNLTQGDQQKLQAHGIDSLDGLSTLYERLSGRGPTAYEPLDVDDSETVGKLESAGRIGNQLEELGQRAQVLRSELDPTYEQFDDVQYLQGSGPGTLPSDEHSTGSLLRVYLFVQEDYVRNRISVLGARIAGPDGNTESFSHVTPDLSFGQEESREEEEILLQDFFFDLFKTLEEVNADSSTDTAPVHLYFYTRGERDALVEAVRTHSSLFGSTAIRDLLGLREGLDQPMVSVVHDELTTRFALKYPGTGLIQTSKQFTRAGHGQFTGDDWIVEGEHGKFDLRSTFSDGLFESAVPYEDSGNRIKLLLGEDPNTGDGEYPLFNRYGNNIPMEYVWGVRDALEDIGEIVTEDEGPGSLDDYRYHSDAKRRRITDTDVRLLAIKLCEALAHIERSIEHKNTDLKKPALNIPKLPDFGLDDRQLWEACQEYLDLEYTTHRQENFDHYLKPPLRRVRTGQSVLFRVDEVVKDKNDLTVTGTLPYDEFFANPSQILGGTKVKGSDSGGSGSWMVMTQLKQSGSALIQQQIDSPTDIENSVQVTVESIDHQTGHITLSASSGFWILSKREDAQKSRYRTPHRYPVRSQQEVVSKHEEWCTVVDEGALFILDPMADSYVQEYARTGLDYAENKPLYERLNTAFESGLATEFGDSIWEADTDLLARFYEEYSKAIGNSPKGKQRDFVEETEPPLAVLQGPPGTGKTKYTLAPALLWRLRLWEHTLRAQRSGSFLGVVTAPSHTAIDEVRDSVSEHWHAYNETTGNLDDVVFVRLVSNPSQIGKDLPGVEYCHYHGRDDIKRFEELLFSETDVILLGTPSSIRSTLDKFAKSTAMLPMNSVEQLLEAGVPLFDLLVVDEASMIDLPQFLLPASFLKSTSQTLLVGDHRQMEPVQKHEWEGEDRRTIEENIPFMSALNFVRFLRGDLDETESIHRESPNIGDAIPIIGLEQSYRFHRVTAELLRRLVYQQDGIDFYSKREDLLDCVDTSTAGVAAAMDSERPITLVVHGEKGSQDSNLTEVALIEALLDGLPEADPDEVGIVTPHNAQKSRLRDLVGTKALSDTVERFQGGERETIFISTTASDPDYVRGESKFLLNPNRLNVALSRMEKKVVLIASESVFDFIPPKADEYEKTLIWKRLYGELGVGRERPVWRGTVGTFCPTGVDTPKKGDASVEVYGLGKDWME